MHVQSHHPEAIRFSANSKTLSKVAKGLLLGSALMGLGNWGLSQKTESITRQQTIQTVHYAVHPQEDNPTPPFAQWLAQDAKNQGIPPQALEQVVAELTEDIRKSLGSWQLGQLTNNLTREQLTMDEAFVQADRIIDQFAANETNKKVMRNQLEGIQTRYHIAQGLESGATYAASAMAFGAGVLTLVALSLALAKRRKAAKPAEAETPKSDPEKKD